MSTRSTLSRYSSLRDWLVVDTSRESVARVRHRQETHQAAVFEMRKWLDAFPEGSEWAWLTREGLADAELELLAHVVATLQGRAGAEEQYEQTLRQCEAQTSELPSQLGQFGLGHREVRRKLCPPGVVSPPPPTTTPCRHP